VRVILMNIGIFAFGIENKFAQYLEIFHSGQVKIIDVMADFLVSKKDSELKDCARALENKNISINSVHTLFGEGNNLGNLDQEIRASALAMNKILLQKILVLKADKLVIHPGTKVGEEGIRKQEENFGDSLEKLLPEAEKRKITLAVENMLPDHPGAGTKRLKQILRNFSSPYLGVCFDTGHAHVSSDAVEEFELVEDKIITVHLHDNDGNQDMHTQPGYGTIDWRKFRESFQKSGNQSALIIEAFPWQGREVGWMKKEVELLLGDSSISTNYSKKEVSLRCKNCGHLVYELDNKLICYCNRKKFWPR